MIRNAKRVDHVAGLVRREALEPTIARMSEVLGISFYPPIDRHEAGLRVAIALDAGIELIAPLTDDAANPLNGLLASRGEHWMSVVFGVGDLDATCDHLARMGYTPVRRGTVLQPGDPHADRLARIEQATFAPDLFGGLPFVFGYAETREEPG